MLQPLQLSDSSMADWLRSRSESWIQICTVGPDGFERYARLDSDPALDAMQREGYRDPTQIDSLLRVLTMFTSSPDDAIVALWSGFGWISGDLALTKLRANVSSDRPTSDGQGGVSTSGPGLSVGGRDYLLFRGAISEVIDPATGLFSYSGNHVDQAPNLIWPVDRSWFMANDIDVPWTGLAGSVPMMSYVSQMTSSLEISRDPEDFVPRGFKV